MTVFVDTSALYAVLDRDDANHAAARTRWNGLLSGAADLVTTNYVLVETCALVQHRLGLDAVRTLHDDILPVMGIRWINERQHALAAAALLGTDRKKLSLVDCSSFVVMRELAIRNAFAFDRHFAEQGFACDGE